MLTRLALLGAPLLLSPALAFAAGPLAPAAEGSVSIDATVFHDVTPDEVAINVTCEIQTPAPRKVVREQFQQKLESLKTAVGQDGKLRRMGTPSIYGGYVDPSLPPSEPLFTGTMSARISGVAAGSLVKVANVVEEAGCTPAWDVRLEYTGKYARENQEELMEQITDKKEFFESMLGTPLAKVMSVSVSTVLDAPYGSYYGASTTYDPETNTAQAVTTLMMTFDIGTGSVK